MNRTIFEKLRKRKTFSLQADGESMLPLLHPKDLVNYKRIGYSKIKTNDLLLVYKNNGAFTHRVIYKTDTYVITKGDNNLESDGKILPRSIMGKVVSVRRNNKIIDPETIYLIQSSIYLKEITKIINEFKKHNIDYVFLKGLPIHLYYEKSHPRRIYQDADVLIDKADYLKATSILKGLGYKASDSSFSPIQKKLKDKLVEISFYKPINRFPVVFDIHLEPAFMMTQIGSLNALYPQKLIDNLTKEMLRTKKEIKINDEKFFILNSQFLILYLALHFFHHNFMGAFRLELLDKVIRHTTSSKRSVFSEETFLVIIQKYHFQNFIAPVFYLLNRHYSLPISFLRFINFMNFKNFANSNVFNDTPRTSAGVKRFFLLFALSPNPFYRKVLVFFNPQVVYLTFFTLSLRIKQLLKKA